MVLAVPIAIAVALFLTQYAPARLARPLASLVDLLAAVPSIVYGLWGFKVLRPYARPGAALPRRRPRVHPAVQVRVGVTGTIFLAGIVLAIMILPIVTAISREVFAQTPVAHKEGALALGATRWEMIRTAVLPYGRPGVISASMLGLGRALGETIAVTIIVSKVRGDFNFSLFNGGETFASKIANNAAEFDSADQGRRVHRRRPGAVRPDLHRQRARPDRSSSAGRPSSSDQRHHSPESGTRSRPRRARSASRPRAARSCQRSRHHAGLDSPSDRR